MVDDWKRSKSERKNPEGVNEDDAYLAVADKAIELAGAGIARADNASDHLYAGMAYAQKANLFGLRGENRAVARVAVSARAEFIRAIELDPQMADATAGLGLYNYYVDSLSAAVKVLRFFMGIPGGSKEEGLKQLETGMASGVLMKVTARFYLSKNLRNFDYQYARAAAYLGPLIAQYPQNPTYQLLMANLEIEQGHNAEATTRLHAIQQLAIPNPECAARTKKIAAEFLASIHQ